MKYFIDTEFHEYKKDGIDTIELISIGIVAEDGRELYKISSDFSVFDACNNDWLKENVLKIIFKELCGIRKQKREENPLAFSDLINLADNDFTKMRLRSLVLMYGNNREQIKQSIVDFVKDDDNIQFYGYYSDYDWVVFCWLFGRMKDLPKGFPMFCRDLQQTKDEIERSNSAALKHHPLYPVNTNIHNALEDARWTKRLYDFLSLRK